MQRATELAMNSMAAPARSSTSEWFLPYDVHAPVNFDLTLSGWIDRDIRPENVIRESVMKQFVKRGDKAIHGRSDEGRNKAIEDRLDEGANKVVENRLDEGGDKAIEDRLDEGASKVVEDRLDEVGNKAIKDRLHDEGRNKATSVGKLARSHLSGTIERCCPSRAIERFSWSEFAEVPYADDCSWLTTISSENILHDRPCTPGSKAEEESGVFNDPLAALARTRGASLMVCKTCGMKGDHWTFNCRLNDMVPNTKSFVDRSLNFPPACEVCKLPIDDVKIHRSDEISIRVTNLSKDVHESELFRMFGQCGFVVHISLDLDGADSSMQIGIIEYDHWEEAEEAIRWLNGLEYKGFVIGVELVSPRSKEAHVPSICPSCLKDTENCVLVTNIPEDVSKFTFNFLFSCIGFVNDAHLALDGKTIPCRQVGVVEFLGRKDAECAIRLIDEHTINNCTLRVEGPFRLQDVKRDLAAQGVTFDCDLVESKEQFMELDLS